MKRGAIVGILALFAAAAAGCDCGGDDELIPDGDSDTDGDTDGDTDSDSDADNECGEEPCADFEGEQDFYDEGVSEDDGGLFDDGTLHPEGSDPDREPAIVYPNHETMFPINVAHIRHEWSDGGNTLYRLLFEGPHTTVRVHTREMDWEPDEEAWDWIAESNRGEEVTFTVFGLDEANPDDVWQSEPITLLFSRAAVQGAIYYWSTGAQGIMKGLVSSPIPLKFFTDPEGPDADTCVACHTLSRDGTRLAVGYGGEKLWEVSVPDRERILPVGDGERERDMSWSTFSPDGSMLLLARGGVLTLIDSDTGETIGGNDGVVQTIPEGTVATHPDWSALGEYVAITLGTHGGNKDVEGGSIALLPYSDGDWGDPEVVVPAGEGDDNNFFPVWSPDSEWIAYVNAQGKSKDAKSAILRMVRRGGGDPVTLTRINERVNNVDGVAEIGNSMPTWAPSTRPGIFWLAYSSLREYASLRERDDKEDQLWIAAIDPARDGDMSYAGFWAPFQDLEEGNHRAFWTHSAGDTPCYCDEFCGDGLDNDCDGTADEEDCIECGPEEICGNGIDDDCDCVIDECHDEICDDGIDNDGDDLIDFEDPDCPG